MTCHYLLKLQSKPKMTYDKTQMSNQVENPNNKNKYDLEERTALYGEAIIEFLKRLSRNTINDQLIRQLVRSGTSIGANYMEADGAVSKKTIKRGQIMVMGIWNILSMIPPMQQHR